MRNIFSIPCFHRLLLHSPSFVSLRKMSQLPKVFVKHVDAEDKLKIYFTIQLSELPERTFTFMRPKEESLSITLSRMKIKIIEAIQNKMKRKKKKTTETNTGSESEIDLSISLSNQGEVVDSEAKNINVWTEKTQMKINDFIFEVELNPPTVLHLSLPKSIMAGFPVYPKVELEFCSKEECNFSWFRSLSKADKTPTAFINPNIVKIKNENWVHLGSDYFYITTETDIGCKLRLSCIPKTSEKMGLEEIALATSPVEYGPGKCPFEDRHLFTSQLTESGKIRCVSYNILADLYADTDTARDDLFRYCPTEALILDYRKQLYLKEIIGYNADLICLQEVDRKVFYGDLIPVLQSTGLNGVYSEKGGQVIEGLSCFYRTSKFKLIESEGIILRDVVASDPVLEQIQAKLSENEKLKERFMSRNTALQAVLLESLDVPQKRILIGNTHLYFHPESDNIRLLQGASCILYLQHLLQKYQKEEPTCNIGLILSGDFNSVPECGIYQLMTNGVLSEECIDWQSNPEETVPGVPLSHSLSLGSACGTPEYTNYTEDFIGCLDYIFYDKSGLEVCEIVPFPKHEQVIRYKALPNKVFPSDHIALVCTLAWK